ncbi:hypothetical protein, partial [Neomoorella mulderi]|uniref:hypothetical protein n=1 Tax=Neomoorella mulderi TaxID=202604 RepID=UPI001F41A702
KRFAGLALAREAPRPVVVTVRPGESSATPLQLLPPVAGEIKQTVSLQKGFFASTAANKTKVLHGYYRQGFLCQTIAGITFLVP